ncbi:MAG: PSD1 and planctomycete cytochrome C domain-containing protein [Limisphaerales bacterium]
MPAVDFTREVRPILAAHCFKCHGMDEGARKAKLRLDVRENALLPAKSGELPIVPGKPEQSELVRRIFNTNDDDLMPPLGAKNPLTRDEKKTLREWIAQGAAYQPHWAFIAPRQAPLPEVRDTAWPRNAIDYFVLARLENEGLRPSPQADKYTLVRRLYFDILGLPPTPEEADSLVNDLSPGAYERLVDKLLASPHYGERWARRWMDLARYADSNGYEKDRPRSIWPWRDWVVNALNADMPFDEFTIEQLAGDMLPKATRDQLIATGFNRNSMINEEGGIDSLEYRFYSMVDRVQVTSTAWLGLTVACAQCHTHKYDPISQTEYYRFMACLNNASEPVMDIPQPAIAEKRARIQKQINELEAALPDSFPLRSRVAWLIPGAAEFTSKNGAQAEFLLDGSFRVTGNPDKDTYTISFELQPQRLTHIQLEAIPDAKLSKGGPGNSDSGNFVLSEFEMELRTPGTNGTVRKIKFANVQADFAQDGFPEENSIDGNAETGWAVDGPGGSSKEHHAVFALAEPLDLKETTQLTFRLVQNYGGHTTLGRFRVSAGQELPETASAEERRRQQRDKKFKQWAADQSKMMADWTPLCPVAATSAWPTLVIQDDGSVFASGDFTKSDTYTLKFHNLPPGLKALRLEMMADGRLPRGGPGSVNHEGPEGDFWLSTLKVQADGKRVALTNASESYASGGNNAAKAIDADPQTGWSIDGGQGQTQNAVFQFSDPVTSTNELQVEMLCEKYYAAGLGRFRVWVTTESNAKATALADDAAAILLRLRDDPPFRTNFDAASTGPNHEILLREFAKFTPDFAQGRRQLEKLRSAMPKFPTTLVMEERPAGQGRRTFLHHRGQFLEPREEVTPDVPAFLPPLPANAPKNRLALAKWLVSGENPLTGRVIMNRQWEALFGRGIVRTTGDFGYQGELPSHPELLDWLAVEFVKQGWSQKKMLKLMLMSATYQQSSVLTPELRERDPLNILLTHGPRFRMDAEMVRDTALEASGLLSEKMGGPSVFPPQPPGVTTEGAYGPLEWKTSDGPDRYRRSLYTFAKRTAPFAMAAVFDAPSGEACVARRDRSNTPLQALTLLNDTAFMECAQALGAMAANAKGDDAARAELLFRRCLTRPPSGEEKDKLVQFYRAQLARFSQGELKSADILSADCDCAENPNEEAAWTTLARVLLNLDETISNS